jgi:spore coat polysaccharide biosynthesis protein SpsF (cytidylyltransferase family)
VQGVHLDEPLGHVRITVDTAADLELVRTIIEELAGRDPAFSLADVLALLRARPELGAAANL